MANYKKRKPQQNRSTCMLCKPNKNSHNKTANRVKAKRLAFKVEHEAY